MNIFLKTLLIIILLTGLAGSVSYRYGSGNLKNQTDQLIKKLGLNKFIASKSGNKRERNDFEVMSKSETFYSYKDEKGSEYFVDKPNQIPEKYRKNAQKINSDQIGENLEIMSRSESNKAIALIEKKPPPDQFKGADHKIFIYTYKGNAEFNETKAYFEKFNMPFKVFDVVENPKYAAEVKTKLGLDINKKYVLNFPIIEIDGQMIERIINSIDKAGNPVSTSLNTAKINKMFGIRSTYEE